METGLVTWPCIEDDLQTIASRASDIGIESLEIPTNPIDQESVGTDTTVFDATRGAAEPAYARELKDTIESEGVNIRVLSYHNVNPLSADENTRKRHHDHLKNVIESASNMDISIVSTHIGRDPEKPLRDAIEEAKEVWPELLEFAESHQVQIAIENASLDHIYPHGSNLFYNPYAWNELFTTFDSDYFGLNYDPSHLYYLGIDHIEPIERFSDRIISVHTKDTEIREDRLNELGVLTQRGMVEDHWWRYRLPGFGEIDWSEFIKTLHDTGYDGTVSIEHEDATFGFMYDPGCSPPENPKEREEAIELFWNGVEFSYETVSSPLLN